MLPALLLALVLQAPGQDLKALSERELVGLMPRLGESDREFDPTTGGDTLVPALEELRQRIAKGRTLDLECWRTILIDKGFLRWRRDWPVTEPFAVSLHLPALEQGLSVRLVPRVHDWKPATAVHWETLCCVATAGIWEGEEYQVLGTLDADVRELSFDLVPDASGRSWNRGATALVHALGPISIEVRPTRHLDEVLHRRRCSPPGEEIVRALHIEVDAQREFGQQLTLVAHAPTWPSWLACSLEVTIVGVGPPRPKENLWLRSAHSDPSCRLEGVAVPNVQNKDFSKSLKIHLRGTFDGALRDWDATQYWVGEIEVPVVDLIRR